MHLILVLHAAITFFMCGLIWFVQIVHYPNFCFVHKDQFVAYEQAHMNRTGLVVTPLMLLELLTGIILIWERPEFLTQTSVWLGFFLLAVIWFSSGVWQAPRHRLLLSGFDRKVHRSLVATNWVRTIAWTLRSILMVFFLLKL